MLPEPEANFGPAPPVFVTSWFTESSLVHLTVVPLATLRLLGLNEMSFIATLADFPPPPPPPVSVAFGALVALPPPPLPPPLSSPQPHPTAPTPRARQVQRTASHFVMV